VPHVHKSHRESHFAYLTMAVPCLTTASLCFTIALPCLTITSLFFTTASLCFTIAVPCLTITSLCFTIPHCVSPRVTMPYLCLIVFHRAPPLSH